MPSPIIEDIFNALYTAVTEVYPSVYPDRAFRPHLGAAPLEESDDLGRWRSFYWEDGGGSQGPSVANRRYVQYNTTLLLVIGYPIWLQFPLDNASKAVAAMRISDRVLLNERLNFGSPLTSVSGTESNLLYLGDSRTPKTATLRYQLIWTEPRT